MANDRSPQVGLTEDDIVQAVAPDSALSESALAASLPSESPPSDSTPSDAAPSAPQPPESMKSDAKPPESASPASTPIKPTKARLLDAALVRFARDGWGGTSIRDLAGDVGIRESSVYKHFPSKQAIFDALLERADTRMTELAASLHVSIADPSTAASDYHGITEERLAAIADSFFTAHLHDPELAELRRFFTVNQYRDPDVAHRLHAYWFTAPLDFQESMFTQFISCGEFLTSINPRATALAFFGPILTLLYFADQGDDAEATARQFLRQHIHHFCQTHVAPQTQAAEQAHTAHQSRAASHQIDTARHRISTARPKTDSASQPREADPS